MRYRADITAGALKLPESRVIADLLIRGLTPQGWREAIHEQNVLQTRSPATAKRLTRLIRGRLELMEADLWRLVRDGEATRCHPRRPGGGGQAQPLAGRLPRSGRP